MSAVALHGNGCQEETSDVQGVLIALYRALGAGVAIATMEYLAKIDGEPLWLVPFVTSIVLAMALPDSDPAQPWAIIGGHMISCAAGVVVMMLMGRGEMPSAVAVGLATVAMIASRTLHPPAGIDAFLIASHGLPLVWVLNPVLLGAVILAGFVLAWRWLERRLFLPGDRAAAPSMWGLRKLKLKLRRASPSGPSE